MKISASIYSNPNKNLNDIVRELDSYHVDYLHVDCNDDLSVFDDIKEIRKYSNTPIDLHVISDSPEKYFDGVKTTDVELICFQYENLRNKLTIPSGVKSKVGLAIKNETPISVFDEYFETDLCSFGLLMTTTPGQSGGKFNQDTYSRIKEFKAQYPNKSLHIDGGVNNEIARELRKLNVECSVSGSYLLKANKIGEALLNLKTDLNSLNFKVSDFMLRPSQLPILNTTSLTLENVLNKISHYKMAFCIIQGNNGELIGIVTDGDLRRELLSNLNDLNNISIDRMTNRNPIRINSESTVGDAFELIDNLKKQIMFLPVVDESNILKGAISINQLIKGNL